MSVPQKNQPSTVVIYQCAWYVFLRYRRYKTVITEKAGNHICSLSLLHLALLLSIVGLQLTTLLLVSTVDAYRFYAKLNLVAQINTLDLIEKSNLAQNLQASTVDTNNKDVICRIPSRITKQCVVQGQLAGLAQYNKHYLKLKSCNLGQKISHYK